MSRITFPIKNQQGSVMALALMVLVTLTIVGLTTINDTVLESTIARNHTLYRQNLYLAEGAVRQAVQIMQDYTDDNTMTKDLMKTSGTWVKHYTNFDFNAADFGDFRGDADGTPDYGDFLSTSMVDPAKPNEFASGYLVRYEGIAAGSSLDMTDPTSLYQFSVYGRGIGPMRKDPTEAVLKVGYRMRY